MELWLRPYLEPRGCRFRILGFSDEKGNELFFVGQWKKNLFVHGRQLSVLRNMLWAKKVFEAGAERFFTITSGEQGTSFYRDGRLVKSFPSIRLIAQLNDILDRRLLIGNSPQAACSWSGEIFGVGIYDKVLSPQQVINNFHFWKNGDIRPGKEATGAVALYDFRERSGRWSRSRIPGASPLWLPEILEFKHKLFAQINFSRRILIDIGKNIVGFIPLGFFLVMWLQPYSGRLSRGPYASISAIIVGVSVSLTIEALQAYLPSRSSSIVDVGSNSLGTIIGIWLSHISRVKGVLNGHRNRT